MVLGGYQHKQHNTHGQTSNGKENLTNSEGFQKVFVGSDFWVIYNRVFFLVSKFGMLQARRRQESHL